MELNNYMVDGANYQAQAVAIILRGMIGDGLEKSWNDTTKRYDASPEISRWENCREQGYVVSMRNKSYSDQINIAFFEHRNSDSICAVKWNQITTNSPTIDTAVFGDVYKNKWDTSHDVGYGEFMQMAKWIREQFESFYE
jgi:hypothetical protein